MAFTRYASFEVSEILALKGAPTRQHAASLDKVADYENYRTDDGYLYVRIRAISSRINKNHDGWPSVELAGSPEIFERHHSGGGFTVEAGDGSQEYGFATFLGKPIFVDHHNSNPKKARGVIVDAKLNVLDHKTATVHDSYWSGHDVDPEHLPPTEVELLLEIDAKSFPRLAKAIIDGDLDGFSMGCDVERSKCSHCGHIATNPDEFCSHILMKGAHHDFKTADGQRIARQSYENCYGVQFFELSAVFDPADETALAREVRSAVHKEGELQGGEQVPEDDPLRGKQDNKAYELAQAYERHYQMDPATALELAVQKVNQEMPLPDIHGEGSSAEGLPKQYQYDPMPSPVEQSGVLSPTVKDFHNDPRWSSTKTAENPLPQSFETRAPEELDTLRNEQLCPICGNDMEAETCQVCGYVAPPKEFDNPDLSKAVEIREEMKNQEQNQALDPSAPPSGEAPGGQQPGRPLSGPEAKPTKAPATAGVTNEMRWTPKVHPKTAARINQVEEPVRTTNQPVTDEPKDVTVISDQARPVTSAMRTAQQLMTNAQRKHIGEAMSTRTADGPTPPGDTSPKTRTDATGVGGVDEASNEQASKADAQVDATGIGGTGVSDVSADKTESLPAAERASDDAGFNTDKTTEDSGPTATFPDSDGTQKGITEPVTQEPFPASADGVKASGRHALDANPFPNDEIEGGSATRGVSPADPVGNAQDRVDVLTPTTTPSNNSGETTTWSGTDGNGVLRQQEPVTQNLPEWGGVPVPSVQFHTKANFIAAIRLAEAEQELGLINRDQKWSRIAELDAQNPTAVKAQLDALARVKTAGLAKLAQQRQSGVRRLPQAFGKNTAAPHGFERIATESPKETEPVTDDVLDAALFSR